MNRVSIVFAGALAIACSLASAQATIPFDTVPAGTRMVAEGGAVIGLEGDTDVTGHLATSGEVAAGAGVRFPDGTLQTTAAGAAGGGSANAGLYDNRIADFSPPHAYTEVCFEAGGVSFDIHSTGEPTTGGNCVPGDIGWVIERFERDAGAASSWTAARADCLMDGMRLPEPFEWQFACFDAATFALDSMTDDWEWSSNAAQLDTTPTLAYLAAVRMGNGSCSHGGRGSIGNADGGLGTFPSRCVR